MNDFHVTDLGFGAALEEIRQAAYGISKPHLPWYVPRKYFDLYPLDSVRLPIVKEDDLADVP
jgi:hypothetical protein